MGPPLFVHKRRDVIFAALNSSARASHHKAIGWVDNSVKTKHNAEQLLNVRRYGSRFVEARVHVATRLIGFISSTVAVHYGTAT